MQLSLPNDADKLMRSFKSKLRSQIKKPLKEGCSACIGQLELLDDFYDVFAANMRDLGSPVHAKNFIKNALLEFPSAKICMVHLDNQPIACSVLIGFKNTMYNPWASSLRKYSAMSPNMLLYWKMLEYACVEGYRIFDFGRSTPGEGTYKFKQQWGAKSEPLHWHLINLNSADFPQNQPKKPEMSTAIQLWQRMPVSLSRLIGPRVRKYISL